MGVIGGYTVVSLPSSNMFELRDGEAPPFDLARRAFCGGNGMLLFTGNGTIFAGIFSNMTSRVLLVSGSRDTLMPLLI